MSTFSVDANNVYTTNTNQTAVMGKLQLGGAQETEGTGGAQETEETPLQERANGGMIEDRSNPYHDAAGRFTTAGGVGAAYPGAGPGAKVSKETATKNIRSNLIGTTTSDRRKVESVHPHAIDQIIARDVHVGNIKNALKIAKPKKGNKPHRLTYEYRGTFAVLDTQSNMIVTVKYVGKERK